MSTINTFDFDLTHIPGDGTCFYHMLSVALYGKPDGATIRADVHRRWNSVTDVYVHVKSEAAFNRYLISYMAIHLGEPQAKFWKLLLNNKPELFRLAGAQMFGGNTQADDFAISIIAMLYSVELNVVVVTQQPSGELKVSDIRKFPVDQTTEGKYGNFKNWHPTVSLTTALYNSSFYIHANTTAEGRYPNHFTNVYHVTKTRTYANVLSGAGTTTASTCKVPGGWDNLLDGVSASLIQWISRG